MNNFNIAKALYPHHATRSKTSAARAVWLELTNMGHKCVARVDSTPLKLGTVTETEEALIEAVKAMKMCVPEEELKFVPGFQVWLHQARFLDYDDDERKELADKFDKLQGIQERLKEQGKLRVV